MRFSSGSATRSCISRAVAPGHDRRDRQGLDGEGWILRPSELDEGIGAGSRQQDDEEQGDGPFANGDCGKIEAHSLPPAFEAILTRAPSCKR